MKFPKVIKHRKTEVTIYGKSKSYPFYRVAYRVNGQRQMKSFATFGKAKGEAGKKARELSGGSHSLALTSKEVTAALAIREALESFRQDTGRAVTPLEAVTQYLQAAKLLSGLPLNQAVEGYLRTVAVVRRKPLSEAVEDFVASRAPKAEVKDGKRPTLNPKYVENAQAGSGSSRRRFLATMSATSAKIT